MNNKADREKRMGGLMAEVLEAHGGASAWNGLTGITARALIGGGMWALKGQAGVLADVTVSLDTRRQLVEYRPFGEPGLHSVWNPARVSIERESGDVVEFREDPRASMAGHSRDTPWDRLDLAYFSGYAIWTYLMTPFLFTWPGVVAREVEPWTEDGEVWRRLQVKFAASIATHCAVQTFYFGPDGILRRHDYNAEVFGGVPAANYALSPRQIGGLVFPTERRIYIRGDDNRPIANRPPGITIQLLTMELS